MGDSDSDKRVKKKLLLVLLAWDEQYKDDPNMQFAGGILKQYGSGLARRSGSPTSPGKDKLAQMGPPNGEEDTKQKKKVDILSELRKSERAKIKKEPKKKKKEQEQNKRVPFDFEKV